MHPLLQQVLKRTTLKTDRSVPGVEIKHSTLELARGLKDFKRLVIRQLKDFILITLGIFTTVYAADCYKYPLHYFSL